MAENVIRFLLLLLLALLVGTMFGIWVGFNPSALSAGAYVEQQQIAIRSLNALLPAMGAACIVLAAVLAWLAKHNMRVRGLLAGVVLLLGIAALITRFGNQPINAIVISWSAKSPPAEWLQLRDQWWQWHVVRTLVAIGALVLAIVSVLSSQAHRRNNAP